MVHRKILWVFDCWSYPLFVDDNDDDDDNNVTIRYDGVICW